MVWWFRNPAVEVGISSHYAQGFIHPRWLFGIFSTKTSITICRLAAPSRRRQKVHKPRWRFGRFNADDSTEYRTSTDPSPPFSFTICNNGERQKDRQTQTEDRRQESMTSSEIWFYFQHTPNCSRSEIFYLVFVKNVWHRPRHAFHVVLRHQSISIIIPGDWNYVGGNTMQNLQQMEVSRNDLMFPLISGFHCDGCSHFHFPGCILPSFKV